MDTRRDYDLLQDQWKTKKFYGSNKVYKFLKGKKILITGHSVLKELVSSMVNKNWVQCRYF